MIKLANNKKQSLYNGLKYLIEMRYLTINWFADAPVVEISPTNLTAIEGEEVMILCTYDSNPSLLTAVRWWVSVFSILEFSCIYLMDDAF